MEDQDRHRDELGNIVFPGMDHEDNREQLRKWQFTYIFEYYDENLKAFRPCFDLDYFEEELLEKARLDPHYIELELHRIPLEMIYRDVMIYHRNLESEILAKYFRDLFHMKGEHLGNGGANKYYRIIMRKEHYYSMANYLNDKHIWPLRDLFIEIFANAQHIYIEDVFPNDNNIFKRQVTQLKKDIVNLSEVIEHVSPERIGPLAKRKKRKELQQISFLFNDATYKLNDRILIIDIVEQFKNHLDQLPLKNWQKSLERYAHMYDDDLETLKFKEYFTRALYNMVTEVGLFPIKGPKFPNALMDLLDDLIAFTFIPVGTPDEIKSVRIKHIRNFVGRNELKERIHSQELEADKDLLLKYFDPEFIAIAVGDVRGQRVFQITGEVVMRFDLRSRVNEISFLVQCLTDVVFLMFDQVSNNLIDDKNSFPAFSQYQAFFKAMNQHQQIRHAAFKLDGLDEAIEFKDELPLYILSNALTDYARNSKEEVENDIVKEKIKRTADLSLAFNYEPRFHFPRERFIVGFVKSFYNFLMKEFPPEKREYRASDRYYAIIAVLLKRVGYFRSREKSEEDEIKQVAEWHRLSII